jgi:transcriptional regulator with XRE-family HTH domain
MDSSHARFAANLRRQRKRRGLSQEALADLCDLHRTEISLLERCKRSPRLDTIISLARGLELSSPSELLEGIA